MAGDINVNRSIKGRSPFMHHVSHSLSFSASVLGFHLVGLGLRWGFLAMCWVGG